MSEPTCFIIDDDCPAVNELTGLLINHRLARLVGTCTGVALAMKVLASQAVDILFIRIKSWDDWLEQKHRVCQVPKHIVFLFGRKERGIRLLVQQIDHLLQPPYPASMLEPFFQLWINPYFVPRPLDFFFLRAFQTRRPQFINRKYLLIMSCFFARIDRRFQKIEFAAIRYVEADKNYCKLYTTGKLYLVHVSLSFPSAKSSLAGWKSM